jgi:hypothetical protein
MATTSREVGECGHDEEAAPRTDQAGDESDDEAVQQDAEEGQPLVCRARDLLAAADHRDSGDAHHHRKSGE